MYGRGTMSLHRQTVPTIPELLVSITSRKHSETTSWKQTLLTQPPIKAVVLYFSRATGLCTIYNRAGLTLGDIFEVKERVTRSSMGNDSLPDSHSWYAHFALAPDFEAYMEGLQM